MKQTDRDKAERVRSAKVWLDKAEESFRSSSDVQGELSLLLAEAEMKNLRKNHGAGKNLMRYGAVATAIAIALVGLGASRTTRGDSGYLYGTALGSRYGVGESRTAPLRSTASARRCGTGAGTDRRSRTDIH